MTRDRDKASFSYRHEIRDFFFTITFTDYRKGAKTKTQKDKMIAPQFYVTAIAYVAECISSDSFSVKDCCVLVY